MDDQNINYNVEDTGTLLTSAKKGKRTMQIVLIAIAAVIVLSSAAVGFKLLEDKRYNDCIALAEKKLIEGDYTQAEDEYLEAVNMKKKKPDAYKGLAYTYVADGNFEKATETYNTLFELTEDKVFQTASKYTSEGRIPLIADIMPSDHLWVKMNPNSIEDKEEAIKLLEDFISVSAYVYTLDSTDIKFEYCYFNSENPSESYALETTKWLINENRFPEYNDSIRELAEDETDPRGWSEFSCIIAEKDIIDAAYSNLFNVNTDKIADVLKELESRHMMYFEDDHYYIPCIPKGGYSTQNEIKQVWINGDKCCIEYDSYDVAWDYNDKRTFLNTYYAIITRKDSMWTLLYNGSEKPKEIEGPKKDNDDLTAEDAEIEARLKKDEKLKAILEDLEDSITTTEIKGRKIIITTDYAALPEDDKEYFNMDFESPEAINMLKREGEESKNEFAGICIEMEKRLGVSDIIVVLRFVYGNKELAVTEVKSSDYSADESEITGEDFDTDQVGYSEEQLCEMAREHYYRQTGYRPPISEVAHRTGDMISIHLYEINGNHTATSDWYEIDRNTAKGTNILGETIDLNEVLD